jgi:hypothetical protein
MSHTLLTTDVLAKLLVEGPASGSSSRGLRPGLWRGLKIPTLRVRRLAPGCARVAAQKYLDTVNVSFSTTAAKQRGACRS